MTPPLTQALYVSRLKDEAAAQLPATMRDILATAHRNNLRDRISGFLWCDGETFTQVFEGPQTEVDDLLARILIDRRHHDMRLRLYAPIRARAFPRWTMCGLTLSDLDETILAPKDIEPDLYAVEAGAILALLGRIAEAYGQRLDAAHAQLVGEG